MSQVLKHLLNKDIFVVFDVDGVLAAYEFGKLNHNAENRNWEEYVIKNKPYDNINPVPQLQRFIHDKGKHVYVCSVATQYEEENKKNFVIREYGIPEPNIKFVKSKEEKVLFLKELAKIAGSEEKVALVDDTVSTLNQIFNETNCITVHISSFFFYNTLLKKV